MNLFFSSLYIDHAQSIPCPFDQSWYFKKTHQICQPRAFDHCSTTDTFQISYQNQCEINQSEYFSFDYQFVLVGFSIDLLATCFAQFADGNRQYFISRSIDQKKFICFVNIHRAEESEWLFRYSFSRIPD